MFKVSNEGKPRQGPYSPRTGYKTENSNVISRNKNTKLIEMYLGISIMKYGHKINNILVHTIKMQYAEDVKNTGSKSQTMAIVSLTLENK